MKTKKFLQDGSYLLVILSMIPWIFFIFLSMPTATNAWGYYNDTFDFWFSDNIDKVPFFFWPLAKIVQSFDWKGGSIVIQFFSFFVTLIFIGTLCSDEKLSKVSKIAVRAISITISLWWIIFFIWTWYCHHEIFVHG